MGRAGVPVAAGGDGDMDRTPRAGHIWTQSTLSVIKAGFCSPQSIRMGQSFRVWGQRRAACPMGKGGRAAVTMFPHESWESHVGLKHFLQGPTWPVLSVLGLSQLEHPVPCASQRGDVPSAGRRTLGTAHRALPKPPASPWRTHRRPLSWAGRISSASKRRLES